MNAMLTVQSRCFKEPRSGHRPVPYYQEGCNRCKRRRVMSSKGAPMTSHAAAVFDYSHIHYNMSTICWNNGGIPTISKTKNTMDTALKQGYAVVVDGDLTICVPMHGIYWIQI